VNKEILVEVLYASSIFKTTEGAYLKIMKIYTPLGLLEVIFQSP
jgi:hypothetical protein